MGTLRLGTLVVLAGAAWAWAERTTPATFYVDSENGKDEAAGTAETSAWKSLDKVNAAELIPGDCVRFKRGGLWRGQFVPKSGSNGAPVVYSAYGTGGKPILQGSVARSRSEDWSETRPGVWAAHVDTEAEKCRDVGIVILNHGEKWGVKKWTLADVKQPFDYWYDEKGKRIFLACDKNPAEKFKSVELALTRHIVTESNRHDVIYDGLAIRYGGAHGFGGGCTSRITIRNCDVYWIGGGLQYWKKRANGTEYPVRFGNGIEFWGSCDNNLVERNRLWQIYDAALTNQGRNDKETNITYRDNVIWQAEYSFEYWNAKQTANILFEHNTCVDAGFCWSHDQRPNPNGAHLMVYNNPAATTNFVVRNNIFVRSSDRCTRMWSDWHERPTMQNNLYWSPDKPIMRWMEKTDYPAADFANYQSDLGFDTHSAVAEPQFVDPARHDYRLKPGTPGTTMATDGGPVGARFDLNR